MVQKVSALWASSYYDAYKYQLLFNALRTMVAYQSWKGYSAVTQDFNVLIVLCFSLSWYNGCTTAPRIGCLVKIDTGVV